MVSGDHGHQNILDFSITGRVFEVSKGTLIRRKNHNFGGLYLLRYESGGHEMWIERGAMTSLRRNIFYVSLSLSLSLVLKHMPLGVVSVNPCASGNEWKRGRHFTDRRSEGIHSHS